jgi:hypothetical protein
MIDMRMGEKHGINSDRIKVRWQPITLPPGPFTLEDTAINEQPDISVGNQIGRARYGSRRAQKCDVNIHTPSSIGLWGFLGLYHEVASIACIKRFQWSQDDR